MSSELITERVCYVHCNFCNTILAVSVPWGSMFTIVTVRCGHCSNLLSVNMGGSLQSLHYQEFQLLKQQSMIHTAIKEGGSSSKVNNMNQSDPPKMPPPIRPPEKRQRVPSAYNRFIREEIQRIKAKNPEISHREAFSTAAKNWAHFPHIQFGLNLESSQQRKLDLAGEAAAHNAVGF